MACRLGDQGEIALGDLAHDLAGRTHDHRAVRYRSIRWDQGARGDQTMTADDHSIEHTRTIGDQGIIAHGTAVQEGDMPHRDPFADAGRNTAIGVNDAGVLDVAVCADFDPVVVTAQHHLKPETRSGTETHAADDVSRGRNVGIGGDLGSSAVVFVNHAPLPRSRPSQSRSGSA